MIFDNLASSRVDSSVEVSSALVVLHPPSPPREPMVHIRLPVFLKSSRFVEYYPERQILSSCYQEWHNMRNDARSVS